MEQKFLACQQFSHGLNPFSPGLPKGLHHGKMGPNALAIEGKKLLLFQLRYLTFTMGSINIDKKEDILRRTVK